MGGCGGKKQREKRKAGTGPGGQFDSIGQKEQQQQNLALCTRLLGEIGSDGERLADSNDKLFLQDCRIKLNQFGANAMFGWRQVESMVRVHGYIQERRMEANRQRARSTANGVGTAGSNNQTR